MTIPRQAIRRSSSQRKARIHSMSAPVGGWNARDSLDRMAETDAVVLDNWFPDEGEVRVRNGHTISSTGTGGDVEMLAEYHAGATQKFLAAANGSFWDVTSSAASKLASGFSSNRWQWTAFEGEIGFVNGSDSPRKFSGSAISALSITASAVSTVSSFVDIHTHKSRTYFIPKDSQDFYYSAVNALGGTLTKFPLSRVSQFGGNLMTLASWSRDGGDGSDDLLAFIMTSGEVIVYQGSNPGDALDWSIVGVFNIPRPVDRRGVVKIGGDIVIATQQGYFPLSAAFQGRVGSNSAISDKISGAVKEAVRQYGSNFGWEGVHYPGGHWLLFNVPISTNSTYHQHVMNMVTGAWCRFKGVDARTWGMFDGELYFGGDGSVFKIDQSNSDNGSDIVADGQTAYTYIGGRASRTQFTGLQPVFSTSGTINFDLSIGVDFRDPSAPAPERSATPSGATWDEAEWDEAEWAGGLFVSNTWRIVSGLGYNMSLRLGVRVNGIKVRWFATNIMYKIAGVI